MIERVASAILKTRAPKQSREAWAEAAARAVIHAMREPTAAMIQTACPSHTPGVEMSSGRGECPHHRNAAFRWRQMIDEALK